jgi:hypothetical protein
MAKNIFIYEKLVWNKRNCKYLFFNDKQPYMFYLRNSFIFLNADMILNIAYTNF